MTQIATNLGKPLKQKSSRKSTKLGQDGMTLAKVKKQDGMTLAKVKKQDGMTLAKVKTHPSEPRLAPH